MTTHLSIDWLNKYIPQNMDPEVLEEYALLTQEATTFERTLQSLNWTPSTVLSEWSASAPTLWGKQRRLDVMDEVRRIIRVGAMPYAVVSASPGAVEFEDIPSRIGSVSDWTWDEDWGPPITSPPFAAARRRQRPVSTVQRQYQCTALATPLLTLLGSLIQEYTHLPNLPVIAAAQTLYTEIFRDTATLFRVGGSVLVKTAGADDELCLRLVNDCFYLAGEVALVAVGMGHMGYGEVVICFREIVEKLDLCGVLWRDRYLEGIKLGLMQRIQAAEGFVFASNLERRDRYSVIISGLIQQLYALSNLWTVPTPPHPN